MKVKASGGYYHEGRMYQPHEEFEIQNPGADVLCLVELGVLEELKGEPVAPMTTENTAPLVPPPARIAASSGDAGGGGV